MNLLWQYDEMLKNGGAKSLSPLDLKYRVLLKGKVKAGKSAAAESTMRKIFNLADSSVRNIQQPRACLKSATHLSISRLNYKRGSDVTEAAKVVKASEAADAAEAAEAAAGIAVPGEMQGVSQWSNWQGGPEARDFILCENRHNPVMPHVETYVDRRYKITVYRQGRFGELFDLQDDPGEIVNLWDDPASQDLKARMLHAMIQGIMKSEPTRMPRIAGA